jgi:hypothetical protein
MVSYMIMPQSRVTVGANTFTNDATVEGKIVLNESGIDVATLKFSDPNAANRTVLAAGSTVTIDIKDAADANWINQIAGVTRWNNEELPPETDTLNIDSIGYMLTECLCAQEYGAQSSNPTLNTLQPIVQDIVANWVQKVLNTATSSGYSLDTSKVDAITGAINYLYNPYKPATKCLQDLFTQIQALKGASAAGPHWRVTRESGTTYLRTKLVGSDQTGWTSYYGGSQAAATLTQGVDFLQGNFKTLTSEANYVLYHSPFIWPGNGDYISEIDANWGGVNVTFSLDSTVYTVGAKSVKGLLTSNIIQTLNYPASGSLGLDLTKCGGKYNIPTLNFWIRVNSTFNLTAPCQLSIRFAKDGSNYELAGVHLDKVLSSANTWAHVSIPIGPNWLTQYQYGGAFQGIADFGTAATNWANVNSISFELSGQPTNAAFYIDNLNISGFILRAAYNSTKIAANGLKTRLINDPQGKTDSLVASDASGQAAMYAAAELFKLQSTPIVGTITVPMIKDLQPGQFLHIHARPNSAGTFQIDTDMRATQVIQGFSGAKGDAFKSTIALTSDLYNAYPRAAYDSANELAKAQRPDTQDRQAAGLKLRDIDITQPILGKDYPSA